MALIACGECNREISTLAKICPGCGAPARVSEALHQMPKVLPASSLVKMPFERRATARLTTNKSLGEVVAIVGKQFATIEPKFSIETLSFKNASNFVRVSVAPVDGGYLLVVDHNYVKQHSWSAVVNVIGFGLLWYYVNIWLSVVVLTVGGLMMASKKLTAVRIEECIGNLTNEVT